MKSLILILLPPLACLPLFTGCLDHHNASNGSSLQPPAPAAKASSVRFPKVAVRHESPSGSKTLFSSWDAARADRPFGQLILTEATHVLELYYDFRETDSQGDVYEIRRRAAWSPGDAKFTTKRIVFSGDPVILFDDEFGKSTLVQKPTNKD